MKNKIFGAFVLLLLSSTVFATANITTVITTNGNMSVNETLNSDNMTMNTTVNADNFKFFINGKSYPIVIKQGMSWSSIMFRVTSTVNYILGKSNYYSEDGMNFLNSLANVFVTREEISERDAELKEQLRDMQADIYALKESVKLINKTAYCRGQIDALKEFNITNKVFQCGDWKYELIDGKLMTWTNENSTSKILIHN